MKMAGIIATCLIVVGLVVGFVGMASVGFDFSRLVHHETQTAEYSIEDPFTSVSVENANVFDVTLRPSEDGSCKIVSEETDLLYATPTVESGTLRIKVTDARKWYHNIFSFYQVKVTAYLPEQVYESIAVDCVTGDVSISNMITNTLSVELTTGDVYVTDVAAAESMNVTVTTGDVSLANVETTTLSVDSTTGDVSASAVVVGVATFESTTGDVSLSNVTADGIHFNVTTGDVSLSNVQATQQLYGDTTTGSVTLDHCDSIDVWIVTTTGDIRGSICTEKIFITDTSTGDIDVPQSGTGNICRLETTTGDIVMWIG